MPAATVLAAYTPGETRLVNVAHARIKETDRIAVMTTELSKIGIDCSELSDGLKIRGRSPNGGDHTSKVSGAEKSDSSPTAAAPLTLDGHGDHRIVMALAVAALAAPTPITILGAEAADVTYPGFWSNWVCKSHCRTAIII